MGVLTALANRAYDCAAIRAHLEQSTDEARQLRQSHRENKVEYNKRKREERKADREKNAAEGTASAAIAALTDLFFFEYLLCIPCRIVRQ